jgi:hypothetical protein
VLLSSKGTFFSGINSKCLRFWFSNGFTLVFLLVAELLFLIAFRGLAKTFPDSLETGPGIESTLDILLFTLSFLTSTKKINKS